MSLRTAGIDLTNACLLLALESMYGDQIELDFLIDCYIENNYNGINNEHFCLIEEVAPLLRLPKSYYSIQHLQTMIYVHIYDRTNNVRYRVPREDNILLIYVTKGTDGHAVSIPARELITYLKQYKLAELFLQRNGKILRDNRTYEQDVKDGIIES
jgi:hypothetical protein